MPLLMSGWAQMRVAAGVMLALYVGLAAVLSARELRFLASVEPRQRRVFITQDILVQLAILGVLVPCALAPGPSRAWVITVTTAFFLLWVAALWAVLARSMYTYRLMLNARGEQRDIAEMLRESVGASGSSPANATDSAAGDPPVAPTEQPDA